MTPEQLAAKIEGQPFSTMREELMQKVLYIALRNSQKRTPVRKGTLRRSETTRIEAQGERGFIGTNLVYAPFVHERQTFFAEGIEDSRSEIADVLTKIGDQYLGKIAT